MLEKISRPEELHVERVRRFPDEVLLPHEDSVQEQFEYLRGPGYQDWLDRIGEKKRHVLLSNGVSGFVKLIRAFGRNFKSILRNRKRNFSEVEDYVSTLERTGKLPRMDAAPDRPEAQAVCRQEHVLHGRRAVDHPVAG